MATESLQDYRLRTFNCLYDASIQVLDRINRHIDELNFPGTPQRASKSYYQTFHDLVAIADQFRSDRGCWGTHGDGPQSPGHQSDRWRQCKLPCGSVTDDTRSDAQHCNCSRDGTISCEGLYVMGNAVWHEFMATHLRLRHIPYFRAEELRRHVDTLQAP